VVNESVGVVNSTIGVTKAITLKFPGRGPGVNGDVTNRAKQVRRRNRTLHQATLQKNSGTPKCATARKRSPHGRKMLDCDHGCGCRMRFDQKKLSERIHKTMIAIRTSQERIRQTEKLLGDSKETRTAPQPERSSTRGAIRSCRIEQKRLCAAHEEKRPEINTQL